MPNEIPDAVAFDQDHALRRYDPAHATALWRAMLRAGAVMTRFRAGFLGKASPVHLFWGVRPGDDAVLGSHGAAAPRRHAQLPRRRRPRGVLPRGDERRLLAGQPGVADADLLRLRLPEPEGYPASTVEPAEAVWLEELGEFALPYDTVATAADPDPVLARFFETTHAAAADSAGWDRDALECAADGPRLVASRSSG